MTVWPNVFSMLGLEYSSFANPPTDGGIKMFVRPEGWPLEESKKMIHERIYRIFIFAALLAAGSMIAAAQSAPVAGKVELKKSDGTVVPVAGALVEVFRADAKGSLPAAKTDKKGEFRFAGFPPGEFILSVSATGAQPGLIPNVRAGQQDLKMTLNEGDGKRYTEEEVRKTLAEARSTTGAAAPRELTKEEKEAQAKYEKEVAEINARNKKIQEESAVINAALQAGNKAFEAKDFDTAIEQYNIGIAANPDYFGSAPILLNNKGVALKIRGVNTYNQATKMPDGPEKTAVFAKARQDLEEARKGYTRSYELLKNAPAEEVTDKVTHDKAIYDSLFGLTDTYRLLVRTRSITTVADDIKASFDAYQAVERDQAKKVAAFVILGDVQAETGASEEALASYQRALELSPEDPDALVGAGLSLANLGYLSDDKQKFQDAVDYLQKYAGVAPENHRYRNDALALIETLKKEQNVTPQKKAPTRRKN